MHYRFRKWRLRLGFPIVDNVMAPLAGLWRARPSRPRRVLVVRLDHVGDAVMTTAMFEPMRRAWPEAAVDVLGSPWNAEVFRRTAHVGRVWTLDGNWFDRGNAPGQVFRRNRTLLRELRRERYDLGLDPRGDARIAMLLWRLGIPNRVGAAGGGGAALLTWPVDWNPRTHEAERCLDVLRAIGVPCGRAAPRLTAADPPPEDRADVVIHVGAGAPAKQWPLERFAAVVTELARAGLGRIVLVGVPAEKPVADRVASLAGHAAENLAGRTSFGELVTLVAGARLFIGGDSGPAHLAAALGVPTVVLFSGVTDRAQFEPIGARVRVVAAPAPCAGCERNVCNQPGHPCMTGIETDAVIDAARQIADR